MGKRYSEEEPIEGNTSFALSFLFKAVKRRKE